MNPKTLKKPTNVELIESMIAMGNFGKNVRIVGKTREERRKKFREVYYGKIHCDNAEVEYQWFLIKNGLMKTIKHQDAMNKIAKISGLKS